MRFAVIFFFYLTFSNAQNILGDFDIGEDAKVLKLSSYCLETERSVHFSVSKDKGIRGRVLRIFYQEGNSTRELGSILIPKQPNILSAHLVGNVILYTYSYTNEGKNTVYYNQVDLGNNKISAPKRFFLSEKYYVLNSQCDNKATYFLTLKPEIALITLESGAVKRKHLIEDRTIRSIFRDFEGLDLVSLEGHIEKGPIREVKAYISANKNFVLTREIKDGKTLISRFNLMKPDSISNGMVQSTLLGDTKKLTSFYRNEKLFQVGLNRDKIGFKVYNVSEDKVVKEFVIDEASMGDINVMVRKGDTISDGSVSFRKFINSFFGKVIGTTYKPGMVLSVNENISGDNILRLGHVDKNVYSYNDLWFHQWFFQHQMFMQQQNFNNFRGPNYEDVRWVEIGEKASFQNHIVVALTSGLDHSATDNLESKEKKYSISKTVEKVKEERNFDTRAYTQELDFLYLFTYEREKHMLTLSKEKLIID